ncbi:MAG: mechanosensitive ion channel family protein [Candidatus Bathycorpusculaceae bacterium]
MGQIAPWIPLFFQVNAQALYEILLKLATIGVILTATWIFSRILGSLVSKAVGKFSPNVTQQAKRIVTWLVWLTGILISLDQLGLELTVILAILTIGGIMLVISIRDILSNVASREVITTYTPFKIGDWIQVGTYVGRVVDITLMDTILMTPDNEIVYIPNSKITKSIIINRTSPGETRISVPLIIDKGLDLSEVEKNLLEIGTELREELASDSKPEVRVTKVEDHAVEVALLLRINNPAKGNFIASEVRKRAKMRLDELKRKTLQQNAYSQNAKKQNLSTR